MTKRLSRVMRKPTMWFPTRSDTNRAAQSQKKTRSLNFEFKKKRNCTTRVAKIKALISFAVTAKLITTFVFAYAKCLFPHDVAHLLNGIPISLWHFSRFFFSVEMKKLLAFISPKECTEISDHDQTAGICLCA